MRLNGIWSLSLSLFLSISHSILSLSLSPGISHKIKKLAMIVVYRQRSGSQRFKPEKRQTGGAGGAAAANNGDSQKKQKRTDGWMERRWHVCGCVCVTQAASIACGEGNPTQKEVDYDNPFCGDGWMGGWEWMDEYMYICTYM